MADFNQANNKRGKSFTKIDDVLSKFKADDTDKYISQEFQKYGYDLAMELGDPKNVSLYIKLSKETPRGILERARYFVKDAQKVKSRPALFIWKLTQLKKENKIEKENKNVKP